MKQNQLIAIVGGVKKSATAAISDLYKKAQKADLFNGISRTYAPIDDEGFVYPPESSKVVLNAETLLFDYTEAVREMLDLVYSQDLTNLVSLGDIVVDGETIAQNVPVTYLLFLEKQLTDIKTFISALPVLDSSKDWSYSGTAGCYVTAPVSTTKTQKIESFVVAYEATKEHPADVRQVTKDQIIGTWSKVEMSTAMPADRKSTLLARVEKLKRAVILAREKANETTVVKKTISDSLTGFLLQ